MTHLKTQDVRRMRENGGDLTVVNVLGKDSFHKEHIPGSINVPADRDDFEEAVGRLAGGKESTVIVYCANEDCNASPKAARKLEDAGFANVYDYTGGMQAWRDAGLPVEGRGA